MVYSYAFASLRTGLPGVGMVPTSSIPKDACPLTCKSSMVERSCGRECSDPAFVSSSSGVSSALLAPFILKRPPIGSVGHVTPRSKNLSVLHLGFLRFNCDTERRRGSCECRAAVEIAGAQTTQEQKSEVKKGSRVKVKGPLKVYHIPKVPELDLNGLEGEVKDLLREWKGKTISANLPYKVQFFAQIDGREVKFVAHLKDGEFDVVE